MEIQEIKERFSADVVVVGGGPAGMCAAIAAAIIRTAFLAAPPLVQV